LLTASNFFKSILPKTAVTVLAVSLFVPVVRAAGEDERLRLAANAAFVEAVEKAASAENRLAADAIMLDAIKERRRLLSALPPPQPVPSAPTGSATAVPRFEYSDAGRDAIVKFLRANKTPWGLPLSYRPPKGYWQSIQSDPARLEDIMERILTGEAGFADAGAVNLYDAATWQIAMALSGNFEEADAHTTRLSAGRSGDIYDIRAWDFPFRYGEQEREVKRENAFFFRMVSDIYRMRDPLDQKDAFDGFPNTPALHHEDWKPITGENSWAAIIGPLQTSYLKNGGAVPWESEELALALSLLPAIDAMQSSIGAIYHVPTGVHGKHPRDISNENNFSMVAALRMLAEALEPHRDLPEAAAHLETLERIIRGTERGVKVREGMEDYFRKHLLGPEGTFLQGGFWIGGEFHAAPEFAVDVQTWGLAVLGAGWVNREIGGGDESTAYRLWKKTKEIAGYYENGVLRGVGFTAGHDVLSSEWTFGAILMAKETARHYETLHRNGGNREHALWAEELRTDARTMRDGVETLKVLLDDGSVAYNYSNRRYYIIFGWWANPVPTLTSAWAVMMDRPAFDDYFNPFVLGGRPRTNV